MIPPLSLVLLFSFCLAENLPQQVCDSSIYCSDTVIFTCVNEQRGFMTWDVYDDDISITSISLASSQRSKLSARRFEKSAIIAEITYRNSTALASTLTITNFSVSSVNAISCNDIRTSITAPQSCSYAPPSLINVSSDINTILISWEFNSDMYNIIELSSNDKIIKNSSIGSVSVLPYHLNSNTTNVNISSGCHDYVQFIVGRCKCNSMGILENSSVLDKNGTWFLTCAGTNEMFTANCYSNGSWSHIPCEGSGTNMTTSMPTVINGSIIITTIKSNRDNAPTLRVNIIEDHEINSTTTTNSLPIIILMATIIPVFLVLVLLSTVMILVLIWKLNHKKGGNHIESCDLEDDENMTYEPLNHPRPYMSHGTGQQLNAKSNSDGDYSSLKHMKFTLPPNSIYDTIQGEQRNKAIKKIDYTDIHTCSNCGQVKPFEDDKVQYSNIHYQIEKPDELLNLKTLTAQLGQISESFMAFGSVAGISPANLNEVVAKSSSSLHSMTEVCDLWLQKCRHEQSPPTWHTIAEILEIIGHNKLSKDILQVYATGKLPVPVEITLPEIEKDPSVTSTSTSTKLTESEITLMECEENKIQAENELDAASLSEEPPPIPPFNPQCLDEPENMPPPLYEDVQVIALRPLASDGTQHQSGSEETAATFTVL